MNGVGAPDGTDPRNQRPASASDTSRPHQHGTSTWPRSLPPASRKAAPSAAATCDRRGAQVAAESTTYTVRKGETLDELSTRYGVSVRDMLNANPGVSDPNNISAGQKLTIPLTPANGLLPGVYSVHAGDTLTEIAARYHSSAQGLSAANSISNPDSIRTGERIWIPGAGGEVGPGTSVAESDLAMLPPVTTPQARQVNGAVLGVQSAQQALNAITRSAARGNAPARAMLGRGTLQRGLAEANDRLQSALNAEINADVGAHASDPQVAKAGHDITAL